jgi:hypothetical protein
LSGGTTGSAGCLRNGTHMGPSGVASRSDSGLPCAGPFDAASRASERREQGAGARHASDHGSGVGPHKVPPLHQQPPLFGARPSDLRNQNRFPPAAGPPQDCMPSHGAWLTLGGRRRGAGTHRVWGAAARPTAVQERGALQVQRSAAAACCVCEGGDKRRGAHGAQGVPCGRCRPSQQD